MKAEARSAFDNVITTEEEFRSYYEQKQDPEREWSRKKYCITAIPQSKIDELVEALQSTADDMNEEDFNEDGYAKQIAEDETVSDFLKMFVEVKRVPSTYLLTLQFRVEAESEDEAREEVENMISGRADYDVTDVEEED